MARWSRNPRGALVAGVSTGLARLCGCNVWLIRMGWVLAALISLKLTLIAYLVLAFFLPARSGDNQEPQAATVAGNLHEPQPLSRVQQLEEEFRELEKRRARILRQNSG